LTKDCGGGEIGSGGGAGGCTTGGVVLTGLGIIVFEGFPPIIPVVLRTTKMIAPTPKSAPPPTAKIPATITIGSNGDTIVSVVSVILLSGSACSGCSGGTATSGAVSGGEAGRFAS